MGKTLGVAVIGVVLIVGGYRVSAQSRRTGDHPAATFEALQRQPATVEALVTHAQTLRAFRGLLSNHACAQIDASQLSNPRECYDSVMKEI